MKNLHNLYQRLGIALAEVLEHPECPAEVFNHLTEITLDVDNHTVRQANKKRESAHSRHLLPDCLSILTNGNATRSDVVELYRDFAELAARVIEHPLTPDNFAEAIMALFDKIWEEPEAEAAMTAANQIRGVFPRIAGLLEARAREEAVSS
jgi:hypothetical protein